MTEAPLTASMADRQDYDLSYGIPLRHELALKNGYTFVDVFSSDGVAFASIKQPGGDLKYRLVNQTGEAVSGDYFDLAENFSSGIAMVGYKSETDRYGWYYFYKKYINTAGETVLQGNYDPVSGFKEGAAIVYDKDQTVSNLTGSSYPRYFFIDHHGRRITHNYYQLRPFCEGVSVATVRLIENENLNGNCSKIYIDKSGKGIYTGEREAEDFSEGVAWIGNGFRYWLINHLGQILLRNAQFRKISNFSEGFAVVEPFSQTTQSDRIGNKLLIDHRGNYLTDTGYADIRPFSEGFSAAEKEAWEEAGYLNQEGEYTDLRRLGLTHCCLMGDTIDFSEGLAAVRDMQTGKMVYINRGFERLFNRQFDEAHPFRGGVARVIIGGKEIYLNHQGEGIFS